MAVEDIKVLRDMTGAGLLDCKKALEASGGNIDEAVKYLREKGIAKAVKKASRIAAEGLVKISFSGNKAAMIEINSETDFVAKNQSFIDFVQLSADLVLKNNINTIEDLLKVKTPDGVYNDVLVALISRIGEKLSPRRIVNVSKKDNESFGTYIHTGSKIGTIAVVKGSPEVAKDIAMQVAATNPLYLKTSDIPSDIIANEKEIQLAALKNDEKFANKPEAMLNSITDGKVKKVLAERVLDQLAFIKNPDITIAEHLSANKAEAISFIRFEVGEGMEKRNDDFAEEVRRQAQ